MNSSAKPTESKENAELLHRRLVRRILTWQAILAGAGLLAWAIAGTLHHAASFALGAAAAIASFYLLDRFTSVFGTRSASAATLLIAAIRLLLIGGAIFVIMRSYDLQAIPAATGVGITVIAIAIESLRHDFYA